MLKTQKILGDNVNNSISKTIWLRGIVIPCLKDKNILNYVHTFLTFRGPCLVIYVYYYNKS